MNKSVLLLVCVVVVGAPHVRGDACNFPQAVNFTPRQFMDAYGCSGVYQCDVSNCGGSDVVGSDRVCLCAGDPPAANGCGDNLVCSACVQLLKGRDNAGDTGAMTYLATSGWCPNFVSSCNSLLTGSAARKICSQVCPGLGYYSDATTCWTALKTKCLKAANARWPVSSDNAHWCDIVLTSCGVATKIGTSYDQSLINDYDMCVSDCAYANFTGAADATSDPAKTCWPQINACIGKSAVGRDAAKIKTCLGH